jgi:hypothetical protein
MLRADTSLVKMEVSATRKNYPFVVFSACQNCRKGAAAVEHKAPQDIPELPEATHVEACVVRLSELQDQDTGTSGFSRERLHEYTVLRFRFLHRPPGLPKTIIGRKTGPLAIGNSLANPHAIKERRAPHGNSTARGASSKVQWGR